MTEKLYDKDSELFSFSAEVISSEKHENGYITVLNRTAFFPEGGGQYADTGTIDGIPVFDVQIKDGIIYHFTESPLIKNKTVDCVLDKEKRFRNMQNHSGEHIISGLIHSLYGYDNVGFHLGTDVTLDFNGILSIKQLREVEKKANDCVYENLPVKAFYPTNEELKSIDYRSKLDLKDNIRIVKIGDIDTCACCAPHVKNTGEIGIIKIVDFEKYKSGMRIYIKCGSDALNLFNTYLDNISDISSLLRVKREETAAASKKIYENNSALKRKLGEIKLLNALKVIEDAEYVRGNRVLFLDDAENGDMIKVANASKEKTGGITVILSGNDKDGYRYILYSNNEEINLKIKSINFALNGKGGGSRGMMQGSFNETKEKIEEFFGDFTL